MRPGVAFEETEREEKVRGQYTWFSGRGALLELGTGIKLSNESRTAQSRIHRCDRGHGRLQLVFCSSYGEETVGLDLEGEQ